MIFHHYKDVRKRGCVEHLEYTTTTAEGERLTKRANVYLPYGYSTENKYDVLYVIHGGGGHEDAWLDCCQVKNMLDQLFAEKLAKPCMVVFPTYYNYDPVQMREKGVPVDWENQQILFFQKELHHDLIPAVETRYSTYLEADTEEAMRASRKHRAITGFSMGGGTTWYAFLENIDVFATFLPLSGDCWALQVRGGEFCTVETVDYMVNRVKEAGFTKEDFRVFAGTGSADIAYPALDPMIKELAKRTELFAYSDNFEDGNLHYEVEEDAPHTYGKVYQHLYNFLPLVF